MQIKRIQCPKCGVVLDVKNSKNEEMKQINCPKCKTLLQVRFLPQQKPVEAHTFYAPQRQAANAGATQLAGGLSAETQLQSLAKKPKVAKLIFEEVEYALNKGRNIIGRKASTSSATIQIETNDRYMSRMHIVITISALPDGSVKAVLCNDKNKNETRVNGQPVVAGDMIRLEDGNTITMGKTTITYKLS